MDCLGLIVDIGGRTDGWALGGYLVAQLLGRHLLGSSGASFGRGGGDEETELASGGEERESAGELVGGGHGHSVGLVVDVVDAHGGLVDLIEHGADLLNEEGECGRRRKRDEAVLIGGHKSHLDA